MELLRAITGALDPNVVSRVSDFLGEHERNTWTALEQLIPTVTAATINLVSTYGGAQQFEFLLERSRHDGKMLAEINSLLSNRISAFSLLSIGERAVEKIFGDKSLAVANVIAEESGITPDSALELMNITALVLLEVVGREKVSKRFTSLDIPQLLLGQRRAAARTLPAEVARYVELYENPDFDGRGINFSEKLDILVVKLQRLFSS